ncbi:MAG TPA: helix-turn-helix domain-containing protein [Acidimicrobiales bacterium]|nr:helix-turn-helix domain-containing protein [Acidimicrobiales bacterium]
MSVRKARLSLRDSPLVDIGEAADRLGCSERYLRRLIQERRIPFVKLGGSKVRFSVAELEAWVETQRVSARAG